jgi:hypothetical protein
MRQSIRANYHFWFAFTPPFGFFFGLRSFTFAVGLVFLAGFFMGVSSVWVVATLVGSQRSILDLFSTGLAAAFRILLWLQVFDFCGGFFGGFCHISSTL